MYFIKLFVAILPVAVLIAFVYSRCKDKKVDFKILALLFGLGVLSRYPIGFVQGPVTDAIFAMFSPEAKDLFVNGPKEMYTLETYVLTIIMHLISAALIEEGFKFCILAFVTKKFNVIKNLYDGVLCSAFVSLGFAVYENILFTLKKGVAVGFLRAFTSIPGHLFYAVMMGYLFSMYIVKRRAEAEEKRLVNSGMINRGNELISCRKELVLSLFVPISFHAIFNFGSYTVYGAGILIYFLITILFKYIYSFSKIIKISKNNSTVDDSAKEILKKKYSQVWFNNDKTDVDEDLL